MATNTAASFTNHTGNASAGPFSISFSYLSEDEIDVTVGGVLKTKTTHYTFPSATTISFTSGNHPGNGVAIKFQRDTDVSAKKVDFQDGSVLTETDLDNNSDQILFGLQENLDVINNDILKRDGSQTVTGNLVFEGATDDGNETTLAITDPTGDRTLTVPDITGTIVTTGDTGTVTSAMINNGTIVAADLASNSVTTAKITDANVTTAKVADDAITSAKIADNAITSAHIADGTVVAADIGANAVTASELADDAVDTAAIANSAVTNAKLGADAVNGSKIADDSIDSEHYVDGSIDTAHIADSQVTTAKLASNAVTTAKITDANITTAKLADDAVTAAKIADGAITSAHIAADTVVAADIAANAVTASELADNAVDTAAIADNAVTNAKMADDSVTASEIAANAVGASELADNAVDTAAIAADAITGAKIADDAINSEHYTDGSIDTAHIADAQITTAKIADDAVTAAKVGTFNLADLTNVHTSSPNDGQVLKWINSNSRWEPANDAGAGGATLADADYGEITVSSSGAVFTIDNDVITSAKIADNAVVTAAINADAVTGAKIADDAVGSEHIEVLDAALQFGDSVKAQFGTGNDLEIYHDGTNNYLKGATASQHVIIEANSSEIQLRPVSGETGVKVIHNGAVELYHDNALQCKTASYGLDFADNKRADFGDGNDLLIYHDGSHSYIDDSGTGALKVRSSSFQVQNADGSEYIINTDADDGVDLYFNGSKKFETTSFGISMPANTRADFNGNIKLFDNSIAYIGTGNDLQIYHDGSNSRITNATGQLSVAGDTVAITNAAVSENLAKFINNGAVELYYDNVKALETEANGVRVIGPEGADVHLELHADEGDDNADYWRLLGSAAGSTFSIQNANNGSSWDTNIECNGDGNVELYYDNSKKLETSANGTVFSDSIFLPDNEAANFGDGNDLAIYHNGSDSFITHTLAGSGNNLHIEAANSIQFGNVGTAEVLAQMVPNGACSLWYDNSKKLQTQSDGLEWYGSGTGNGSFTFENPTGNNNKHSEYRYERSGNSRGLCSIIYIGENSSSEGEVMAYSSAGNSGLSGGVRLANGATSWSAISDMRLKDKTGDITNALTDIAKIEPLKFTWKSDTNKTPQIGVSAQSVENVVPEAVAKSTDPVFKQKGDNTEYLSVKYTELIPLCIAALKEAKTKIETLETKVAALESA